MLDSSILLGVWLVTSRHSHDARHDDTALCIGCSRSEGAGGDDDADDDDAAGEARIVILVLRPGSF